MGEPINGVYMSLHNLIANGGKIVILGGFNKMWPEFRQHPQLEFWSGDNKSSIARLLKRKGNTLPANTKAVIISHYVSHGSLEIVQRVARERHLTIFPNLSDGEVRRTLAEIVNGTPIYVDGKKDVSPTTTSPPIVVPESSAKVPPAQEVNTQAIVEPVVARKTRKGKKKESDSSTLTLLETFDEAIAGLQLCRERIANLSAENNELREYRIRMEQRIKLLLMSDKEDNE